MEKRAPARNIFFILAGALLLMLIGICILISKNPAISEEWKSILYTIFIILFVFLISVIACLLNSSHNDDDELASKYYKVSLLVETEFENEEDLFATMNGKAIIIGFEYVVLNKYNNHYYTLVYDEDMNHVLKDVGITMPDKVYSILVPRNTAEYTIGGTTFKAVEGESNNA